MLDIAKVTILLSLLLSSFGVHAYSGTQVDPTEPPRWRTAAPSSAAPAAASTSQARPQVAIGTLQSIWIQDQNKHAVIGGKTYREGDRIGQLRVSRIENATVRLSNGRVLSLFPQVSEVSQEK
ncbi:MAG: hypothetical protein R3Y10_02100 [Ferrimonas sp.]